MTLQAFLDSWNDDSDTLTVHTSGSTGQPKALVVEKRRMQASARITCEFLGLRAGDSALLCMPLDFIAGKMMVVRALTWKLRLIAVPPSGHPLATVDEPIDFAAMVPMQVYNSLRVPDEARRLRAVRHLIIGGGAVDDDLARELLAFPHAVWSTYGMTETLSHIALRRLSGPSATEWYTPFGGVALSLTADGCLVIDAPAVAASPLVTNDVAELCEGRFRIIGRRDNTICSGGLKIQAESVERQLAPHMSSPFLVSWRHDPKFGQAVVLLTEGSPDEALAVCQRVLPRYQRPRHYVHVGRIPLTPTGKPARSLAHELASRGV